MPPSPPPSPPLPSAAHRGPRRRTALLVAALGALLGAGRASTRADAVTTNEGLVVEGSVTTDAAGNVTVTTEDGDVRIAAADVRTISRGEGPTAAAERSSRSLAADDVVGRFRLALSLDVAGRPDLSRREYEAIVAVEPDHPAARRALGFERGASGWIPVAEARRRSGLVLYAGAWMLPAEVERLAKARTRVVVRTGSLVSAMRAAATVPALRAAAQTRIASATSAERLEAERSLLAHPDATVRAWACRAIGAEGDESGVRTLLSVCVRDTSPLVRDVAVRAAARLGGDDVAIPLVRALGSERDAVVANAARALAALDDRRAVRYLIRRITSHGASPASYFAHVTQTSYIQDFDVEVAQTSFVADPVVGTIQEGTVADAKVLDVTIERTVVERILIESFGRLARTDAKSAADVLAWSKANGASLPDFSATPLTARRAAAEGAAAPGSPASPLPAPLPPPSGSVPVPAPPPVTPAPGADDGARPPGP